jgi:hypothetical protein
MPAITNGSIGIELAITLGRWWVIFTRPHDTFVVPGPVNTGRVDGMISACATSGEYASLQSQRAEAKRTQKRSETGMEE